MPAERPDVGCVQWIVHSVTRAACRMSKAVVTVRCTYFLGREMGFTDKFRVQHDEILVMAGQISEQLKKQADAELLRKQLSALAGKVNFHLAMEDKALYPRLQKQKGSRADTLATRFASEMGGLARVFTDYNNKWQVSAIRADVAGFSEETRKVFGALAQRIKRENAELYPLADES